MSRRPVQVVCSSENKDPNWKWLAKAIPSNEVSFDVYDCSRPYKLESLVTRPYLPRYRTGLTAALHASFREADLLVSFGPGMALVTELACRAGSREIPHMVFAFNYTNLPSGMRLLLSRYAYKSIDCFVVASTVERTLYSEYLDLDSNRFDVLLWGIQKPQVPEGAPPVIAGDYVCAIGGEGRDYDVLVDAAERVPHVPIAIVTRSYSLPSRKIPNNVALHVELSAQDCWNVLRYSRFSVVPLRDSRVPCGHLTLVASMYHQKALVVTDSIGVHDYLRHDDNALLVPPHDPQAMADAIGLLYEDRAHAERLGLAGERFACENCSEESTVRYFRSYLARIGLS